uniref:Uncharacterized protein n=1 Tax=Physcomitrium patens TaxID=3218 RepID=A0A2K1KJ38_PHYPA|nr:hypothetical protein PHYPA_007469 [Physcomitrium patens]
MCVTSIMESIVTLVAGLHTVILPFHLQSYVTKLLKTLNQSCVATYMDCFVLGIWILLFDFGALQHKRYFAFCH